MRIEANYPRDLPASPPAVSQRSSFHSHLAQHELSAPQARTLLGNAWATVIGNGQAPRASAILTAHWALETDGGRCMPGHNFAGIKAAPGAAGKSFATIEGHGANRREVSARFRVYDSAEAGAHDYVRLLAKRYPDAVAAARVGDSAGFVRALAQGGYFTAAPDSYAAALERRLAMLERGAASSPPAAPAAPAAPGVLARAALEGVLHALRAPPQED